MIFAAAPPIALAAAVASATGEVWYSWPSIIEDNRLTFSYDAAGHQLTACDGAYTLTYSPSGSCSSCFEVVG